MGIFFMLQKYLFATVKHVANGLVGGSGDLELVDICGAAVGEHLADGHHVGGPGAHLIIIINQSISNIGGRNRTGDLE